MNVTVSRGPTSHIPIAILAAGASSRMGQHKLLLPLAGQPVVAWSVRAGCASRAREVLIVLGRDANAVEMALPHDPHDRTRCMINPRFALGQGTSLALAVSAMETGTPGFIVTLADQPFMDVDSIDLVINAASVSPDDIVMGVVADNTGHPVYLPRRLFPELIALSGDRGARDIVTRERDKITRVALANPNAHLDVDTPEDYTRATTLAYVLASAES
jgi:molybdenum cofactor cytidylyltransferase